MTPSPAWWEIASIVGSALATIVLTIFAGVQVWREKRRQTDQAKTAAVQLSGVGYLLRSRLLRWVGSDPTDESNSAFDDWLRDAKNSNTLENELEAGRGEVREMIAFAATAPEEPAAAARSVYVNFLEGVRRLSEHAATSRPLDANQFWPWVQLRSDAVADFRACIEELEASIIEPYLLNTEGSMRRKREEEEPFGQLARAWVKQLESEAAKPAAVSEIPSDEP